MLQRFKLLKRKKNLITKNTNIKLLKEEQDSLGICKERSKEKKKNKISCMLKTYILCFPLFGTYLFQKKKKTPMK